MSEKSKWQCRQDVAQWLGDYRSGHVYDAPRDLEHLTLAQLQAIPTSSKPIYRDLEAALWEMGTKVGPTVGDVMAALGIEQSQLHKAMCWCNHGDGLASCHLAKSLSDIPDSAPSGG